MHHVCVNTAGLHASAAMGLSGRLEFGGVERRQKLARTYYTDALFGWTSDQGQCKRTGLVPFFF
jgi:hypothetical protein